MDYKELEVWKAAMDLVVEIYRITEKFPKSEKYNLSGQMRDAGVSIPSNIAEGSSRESYKDYHRFVLISSGSCRELETQTLIAKRIGYNVPDDIFERIERQKKLINGTKRYLKTKISQ